MFWIDMYDTLPAEDAGLLMMMLDKGNKFYSLGVRKGDKVKFKDEGGVHSFLVKDVYRKHHIYFIYTDNILLPQQAGTIPMPIMN